MRKSQTQKTETHRRIVDAAARLFSEHGIDAVGVDAVMHAAGLTHGGFYGHFPSKEALVAEVATASLARAAERWQRISETQPPTAALEQIVGSYLDHAHVTDPGHGCVLTTLGPEVARRPPEARPAIAASVQAMAEALHRCLPAGDEMQALAALSTMVGAVVLARLADPPERADAVLAAAKNQIARLAAHIV